MRLFLPCRKLPAFLPCCIYPSHSLQHIQLRLDIFPRRQRATLLALSYKDAKLYDAPFQDVHEHLILFHIIPHRSMRSPLHLP